MLDRGLGNPFAMFCSSGCETPGARCVAALVMLPHGDAGASWRVRHMRCGRRSVRRGVWRNATLLLASPSLMVHPKPLLALVLRTRRGRPALRRPLRPLRAKLVRAQPIPLSRS